MTTEAVAAAVGWAVGCTGARPCASSGEIGAADAFVEQVSRHRVGALLHVAGWGEAAGAPAETRAALQACARRGVIAALQMLALQRELVGDLEDAGIGVLVLKGPALAQQAYGDLVRRHVGDLDLLVAPPHAAEAVRALERRGFTALEVSAPGQDWRPELPAVLDAPERYPLLKGIAMTRGSETVDLHWRLFPNRHLMPVELDWLAKPARIDIGGTSAPVLPLRALWRYLCAHGTLHHWYRLKWLADIPALALRHPDLVAPESLREIEEDGLARCVACAALVAEGTLGRFLPDDARRWAMAVPGTAVLIGAARAAMRGEVGHAGGIPLRELRTLVRAQVAARTDTRYRREELRILLLRAGRAATVPDPGFRTASLGPARWAVRIARRGWQ